jgi:chemotaxis methyl-accepting protein methylase
MKKQVKTASSGNEPESSPTDTSSLQESRLHFPVVGIGASAGGLEALEQFLRHVPEVSGIAFVIIQHLDPTHKGIMPELLQRTTGMEVFQVVDRMRVKPDCVYVIPPNRDMSILHGVLHLFEPAASRGLRLPIDFFLRSLADDRRKNSIGVILSGMGSDGTAGLRAIKEMGGVTMAQEPATAKFDSMPRSAINAGLADVVAPAEELPAKIIDYLRHTLVITRSEPSLEEKDQSALEKVLILLRSKTGNDFSLYKKNTIYRRIERRMGIHQIGRIAQYVRYLQENPQEVELLFKELLIGVTSFFRDPESWEQLQGELIPKLLTGHSAGGTLRAWSAGCSTGEEAYSLAIAFKEALEQLKPAENFTLQIFATDLDRDAIEKARQGCYPAGIASDISPERLKRFFIKEENGYRVAKEIREMVTFATQNVIMDPPFTRLDILLCRNLLIYLSPELQKKLMPLFHYSLVPGGVLFLGSAESVSTFTDFFQPLSIKSRLFRRRETFLQTELLSFPGSFSPARPGVSKELTMVMPATNLQSLADQLLLQHFSPPAVLTNDKGDILYISGRTGKYLEPAAGKANWNIFAMAREGIRFELGSAFQRAIRQKEPVSAKGLKIGINGGTQTVDDRSGGASGDGYDRLQRRGISPGNENERALKSIRQRQSPRTGAGTPEIQRSASSHPGGDAVLAGRAQIHQRGAAVHQRRAAVHQRGTYHLTGRDAVPERRAADCERGTAVQNGRAFTGQRRYEEPPEQYGNSHRVPGQRTPHPPFHSGGGQAFQADPWRCRATTFRHRQ